VARGEDNAPALKDRLLQAFRVWSGRDPERLARDEPLILRTVAPLAVLIIVAVLAGTGLGYVLARQADDASEARRRQALTAAVEALQARASRISSASSPASTPCSSACRASGGSDLTPSPPITIARSKSG
jgi:hypothetical protein